MRSDRQNLHEHGRAVCALHARADMQNNISKSELYVYYEIVFVIRALAFRIIFIFCLRRFYGLLEGSRFILQKKWSYKTVL